MASISISDAPSLADLLKRLGGISPRRIRANPPPGTATEQDVIDIRRREKRLYELVDGVLVEKIMGVMESSLACDLITRLGMYLLRHKSGFLLAPDGALRIMPKLIRIPDISYIAWDQLPSRKRPTEPIADLAPALAVEVLSHGNTAAEMARKVREYFLAGTRLVWLVDPRTRTVRVYAAPDQSRVLHETDMLDGGDVLPGLALSLREVFAEVPEDFGASPRKKNGEPRRKKPRKRGPG
jgi:Uma2 family endonuclease